MSVFDFNLPLTREVTTWASQLVDAIHDSFTKISTQIQELNIKEEVRVVKNIAVSAWDLAKANADAIKVLHDELLEVKAENTLLKRRADDMEVYSRKDNLIIRGIDEQKNETEQLCAGAPNSAKFRGGCRFDKEGVTNFLKFLRNKNINFLEFLR